MLTQTKSPVYDIRKLEKHVIIHFFAREYILLISFITIKNFAVVLSFDEQSTFHISY